jgi:hypothetical protein
MFLLISVALFALIAFLGFLATMLKKSRMQRGLGRKVDVLEVNSISNWMEVADNEERRRS